jgi:hypothetical protein
VQEVGPVKLILHLQLRERVFPPDEDVHGEPLVDVRENGEAHAGSPMLSKRRGPARTTCLFRRSANP